MPTVRYRITGARPHLVAHLETAEEVRQFLECNIFDLEDCEIDDMKLGDFLKKIQSKFDPHDFCLDIPDEEAHKRIAALLDCPLSSS
jgi:hypothetical protein